MSSFLNSSVAKKKTPDQMVLAAIDALKSLSKGDSLSVDETADAGKYLDRQLNDIKIILYGDIDHPDIDEDQIRTISGFIQSSDMIPLLISNISVVSFEARKDIALIFNNMMRKNLNNMVCYIAANSDLVGMLANGYLNPDSALSCGSMLRECIRYEDLASYILFSDVIWMFFDSFVHVPNFEVASDAFNTLKELLTTPKHKHVSSEFLETRYDLFLQRYDKLLQSDNYVTKRRSLKLLSEVLLDRSNFNVMMMYISSRNNLKTIMNLLRHKSSNIQFETFHVFKIFVANPNKTDEITDILCKNAKKLVAYLEAFQVEKDEEDPQFVAEKRLLIE